MRRLIGKLARGERGATAIEYGIIVALVCVIGLGGLSAINGRYGSMWGNLADRVPTRS